MIPSDLPMAPGGARAPQSHEHEPQTGPAHDHDGTGLGAPVLEPSHATKAEIQRRRRANLRFWLVLGGLSAAFVPYSLLEPSLAPSAAGLAATTGLAAVLLALFGYLQYCKVNLLTLYEKGIAPPFKPGFTLDRKMDMRVPFSDFERVEVEDNDLDRKEMAEQVFFRFVFHYKGGARLQLTPSILGRDPSREQLVSFFGALKEALGSSIPEKVELRKVFPDGRRPAAAVSSRALRLRVGAELLEFPWSTIAKLRLRPARPGTGRSFDTFDLLVDGTWKSLDTAAMPELKKADLLTFIEEILRIARAKKVEILQGDGS